MPLSPRPAEVLLALVAAFGVAGCAEDPAVVSAERRALLSDLDLWDAASSEERHAAAVDVDKAVADFELRGLETFTCGGESHEIALFEHGRTGLSFALVPAGTFAMGSPHDELDRVDGEAQHQVTLRAPFLICRTEVPQEVWEAQTGKNPARFRGPRRPVELISWDQARAFCTALDLELPTEAQWEYAARAGSGTTYCYGDDPEQLSQYGHVDDPDGDGTRPVGGLAPNAFGLYDVHGNVWEWCGDWFAPFDTGSAKDPSGPAAARNGRRVLKGGAWDHKAAYARSAARGMYPPDRQAYRLGVRPVRTLARR